MFISLLLTAGHHDIEFDYCPPGLKLGIVVSSICWILVIGMLIQNRRKAR